MEPLHASAPQPQGRVLHPPQDAAKRILLLDCDNRRREIRAEALLNRGILVGRAAKTGVARTLWKPGTYDLVLIDLRGADTDCATFIADVQSECAHQKFGFYLAQPPYVTASAVECRSSMHQQKLRRAGADQDRSADPLRSPGSTGVAEAARRIANLRQSARLNAQAREEPQALEGREGRSPPVSESDAVRLARRVLGGS
jgi:hypothetical protein